MQVPASVLVLLLLAGALAALAGCGGSPSGPSPVAAPSPAAVSAAAAATPRPVPAWIEPALVGTLLQVDADGFPKRWEGGPFHHCFKVAAPEAEWAEAAAARMTELSGIGRTEEGPCNVEWISDETPGHTYTNSHGTARAIVFASVYIRAGKSAAIVLHEAGHVLGLGHSPRTDDLMNSNVDKQRDFSPEELAVLAWIYGR
jgi:hypothetical protein